MKDLLEHIREVGLAQREGIKIDQGWDRWEMISLIFMSRFKLIVHRDRDIFGLCRAGLKRPAAKLSSSSRIQYEALFVVSLK